MGVVSRDLELLAEKSLSTNILQVQVNAVLEARIVPVLPPILDHALMTFSCYGSEPGILYVRYILLLILGLHKNLGSKLQLVPGTGSTVCQWIATFGRCVSTIWS